MNRPVALNEKVFDLDTLLGFKGIDPYTNLEFDPREVTSSRMTVEKFESLVKEIKTQRQATVESNDAGPPGGLSFSSSC